MDERRDLFRVKPVALLEQRQPVHKLAPGIVRRGQDFERFEPVGAGFEDAEIDEGAADIDTDPPGH